MLVLVLLPPSILLGQAVFQMCREFPRLLCGGEGGVLSNPYCGHLFIDDHALVLVEG